MAGCFVNSLEINSDGENLQAKLPCLFFGAELRDLSEVSVTILSTDTLAQIKAKIVTALSDEATRLGYSVPASNMILPAFQKGG